jgi:hypothetical protein
MLAVPRSAAVLSSLLALAACGDNSATDGATPDAGPAVDAATSCVDLGEPVGERIPVGDDCNFCTCNADGSRTCSERTCQVSGNTCEYDGVTHAYGERFPSTDDCNECVCAASGLACTRRDCEGTELEEGAILLETLDEPCGDAAFTAQAMLDELPYATGTAPFLYGRERPPEHYPEWLPDSEVTWRVGYDGGFAVCRIPNEGQESIDLEVIAEVLTADGSFDEGFHTYLRKDRTGFVDAWYIVGTLPYGTLNGSYLDPTCIDPGPFTFTAQIDRDGSSFGAAYKICETDFTFPVGEWSVGAE